MWQQEYLFFPWFWLRCTKQSQCSTIAVPSSVLLRAVGLPSPHPASYRCRKEEGGLGREVLLRWLDLYSKFSLFCRFFCTFVCILTKPRFQTKMITEPKNWKVNIVHIWRLIIYFFRSWVLLHSPRQISGLPKLPPFPRTPSEVAIMRKAMKSWELKKKLRKVN